MTVDTKYGADILKQTQAMAEMVKDMMPKINTNKNGYEIRSKILQIAKDQEHFEYQAKFAGWQQSTKVDPETNEMVTTVEMPSIPGVDSILETANKFYDFVNDKK
jgi:Ni,Fe-hydrogenase I large subunit|tara:strand:- start:11 stop:325 length:315 start_codon:yes stop_codon:yes gene_type:complete